MIKLVIPGDASGYMIGKRGAFIQDMKQYHSIQAKLVENRTNLRDLSRRDDILCLTGALQPSIQGAQDVINRLNDFYKLNGKKFSDYSLKIVIDSASVSKLIG